MHYGFLIELDRVAANDRPDMMPWEIDDYLNRAILKFIKTRYSFNDQTKRGFETDQSRIDSLGSLHIKSPELQPAVTPLIVGSGLYEMPLNTLGNNISGQYFRYMFLTKLRVLITKDNCLKTIDATPWQIDDSKTLYTQPSWKWGRVHSNFGKSSFVTTPNSNAGTLDSMDYTANIVTGTPPNQRNNNDELKSVYLDTNNKLGKQEFEIVELYPSYIKRPNRVFIGGYNHIDGHSTNSSPAIHCDLDSAFHDEIVTLAVSLAAQDIQDQLGIQVNEKKVTTDFIV
jgi:hypothetical protein